VADLPYSEGHAGVHCLPDEFDQAMEYLIDQGGEAGVLDNTVIVISGDHYPYGLEVLEMERSPAAPSNRF
jgi:phosphoglycerol transferase MdoB-like AlkP superfamily enzyme